MDTLPRTLTRDQIELVYESGPEAVVSLVDQLQAEIISLNNRLSKLESRVDFDQFLLYLDPDRNRAAGRYNRLQRALVSFFAWRGSLDPESRADETLEVLRRQVAGGKEFEDLEQYSIGVARKLLMKELEKRGQTPVSLEELHPDRDIRLASVPQHRITEKEAEKTAEDECMRSCLQELTDADRYLITEYSKSEGHDKEKREKLAEKMGISLEALRVRVNRIRMRLKKCRQECLSKTFTL